MFIHRTSGKLKMLDYLRVCLTTFPLSQPSNDLGAGEGSKFDENRVCITTYLCSDTGFQAIIEYYIQ